MHLTLPGAPKRVAERPVGVGPGRLRKIGLVGGAARSLRFAPWGDPSWLFWAHASTALAIPWLRPDRYFDLHPKHCFMEERKNGFKNYYQFLQQCPIPIYMQQQYANIPASVSYPLSLILQQWPDTSMGSMTAYMIALALYEGCTHLGFWGIDYQHQSEYEDQRTNAEHWVGIAKGLGVHIIIPPDSPLCHEPVLLYGYQSHTPELYAQRKTKFAADKKADGPRGGPFVASRLVPMVDAETEKQASAIRRAHDPVWCLETEKFAEEVMPERYRTDAERAQREKPSVKPVEQKEEER